MQIGRTDSSSPRDTPAKERVSLLTHENYAPKPTGIQRRRDNRESTSHQPMAAAHSVEPLERWIQQPHTPPHLLVNHTWYLISASTYGREAHFGAPEVARRMCELLDRGFADTGWTVKAYVVMPDHYHMVTKSRSGRDLPEIIRRLHGRTSACIRGDLQARRQATPQTYFSNYWDECLNTEKAWLQAIEYVRINPVSAGLVDDPDDWPYLCIRH